MHSRLLFIVTGIVVAFGDAYSQDRTISDSLYSALVNKSPADRFSVLYDLTFNYIKKDNETALSLIEQAQEAAYMSRDSLWMVKSLRVKGQILYLLERMDEAEDAFEIALPIARRNGYKNEQLYVQQSQGKLCLFKGKYDSSLKLHFNTLELANELPQKNILAATLCDLGITYYKLMDYSTALGYLLRSLSVPELSSNGLPVVLSNIGLCYAQLGDYVEGRRYLEKSLTECGDACAGQDMMNIEYGFGIIALGEQEIYEAEKHFLKSYEFAVILEDSRFQLDNIYLLAQIYLQDKQFKKASNYLFDAEKLIDSQTPFNLEIIKIYSQFCDLYLSTGDFEKASLYQSKYILLKDSVYSEQLTANLMRIEAEYQERENEFKIATQKGIISLNETVIKGQRTLNVLVGLLGLITLAFSVVMFRNYRIKKQLNILLERRVRERTQELECNRKELLAILNERDLMLERLSRGITETINTITGLCLTGREEVLEPVSQSYLRRIDRSSRRLSDFLGSVIGYKNPVDV